MSDHPADQSETMPQNGDSVNPTTIDMREEDRYAEENISDELRINIGDIIEDNDNPILTRMALLAKSDDLLRAQRTIIAYESGDGPLFRTLGELLTLGEFILNIEMDTVTTAFKYLREKLVNEKKASKSEARPNRGLKNIGVSMLPITDQRFFKRLREDSTFLYRVLVNFYFPKLSSTMRSQFWIILVWAHQKHEPIFVTWLAGEHEVTIAGVKKIKRGLTGAFQFIKNTEPPIDKPKVSDDLIEKAIADAKTYVVDKPEWFGELSDEIDDTFMMLGRVSDDQITFVNYITTDESHIRAAIRRGHGSLFPSDLFCDTPDEKVNNSNMIMAIKNLIPFSGAPELILWQDSETRTFVMPLYDQWILDDNPKVKLTDPSTHFAAMVNLFDAWDEKSQDSLDKLTLPDAVNAIMDYDESIFNVGFVTADLDKILEFKGNLRESFRLNDDGSVLEFMGAQWKHATSRRPKLQTEEDKKLKRVRQPAIPAYGYQYISACRSYTENEEGTLSYADVLSENIDFALARAVFKKWSETRKSHGLKDRPEYLTICAKNGQIGMWYENVISEDITYYDNNKELVKVGTCPDWLYGQWRVATYQLTRVWNLITGPWQFYLPCRIDDTGYHPELAMDAYHLESIMRREARTHNLPYGRLKNLCSTAEIDDGLYKIIQKGKDGDATIVRRKCVPLVLRCGAFWMYVYNTTK